MTHSRQAKWNKFEVIVVSVLLLLMFYALLSRSVIERKIAEPCPEVAK